MCKKSPPFLTGRDGSQGILKDSLEFVLIGGDSLMADSGGRAKTDAERQKAYRDRKRAAAQAAKVPGGSVTQIHGRGSGPVAPVSLEALLTGLMPAARDDPLSQGYMGLAITLAREVDNPRGTASSASSVAQIERLIEKALAKGGKSALGSGGLASIVGSR